MFSYKRNGLLSDRCDFATQVKTFAVALDAKGNEMRCTPRVCVGVKTKVHFATPYERLISTSHVERQNLSIRHFNKRFTRLTLGYSKKLMHLRYTVAIFAAYHNFCRKHTALDGKTPAMAAKLTDHVWTVEELLGQNY